MSTQPESAIVNAILRRLNAEPHTYARKTHGNAYSSAWPDIMGASQGHAFAIEVKQPGKRATPRQSHELAKWKLAGARVGVATSVDEAVDIVWPMLELRACTECGLQAAQTAAYWNHGNNHDHYSQGVWCGEFVAHGSILGRYGIGPDA